MAAERFQFPTRPGQWFPPALREKCAAVAIESILKRLGNALDASDAPAPAYSTRGPIYVPLTFGSTWRTLKVPIQWEIRGNPEVHWSVHNREWIHVPLGVGKGAHRPTAYAEFRSLVEKGRSAGELGGRYSLKRSWYLKHLEGLGHNVRMKHFGVKGVRGQEITPQYRNLKSARFEDYAAFKRAIGHSGERDLSVTGAMLRDIGVTENAQEYVDIGFASEKQEGKMLGNLKHSPNSWGFSPKDQDAIEEIFASLIEERATELLGQE